MCGCDYVKRVEELVDNYRVEQNRLSADSLFAAIAVLRGKAHPHHDDRKIATLTEKLSTYSVEALGVVDSDNVNDTDCRSALAVARDLAEKYRVAYEAELVLSPYRVLQLSLANQTCDEIGKAVLALQKHDAEQLEQLYSVKMENEALIECVSFCTSKLRAEFGDKVARKGKKKLTNIAALDKLTESAISQFTNLKAKCESLAEELRVASANNSTISDAATLANHLKSRVAELTRQCSVKDDQTEELRTKLRCSICEEREKDTAFACGHTLCGKCATDCGKCPLRCESERRRKPVKHTFRLYF